MRQCDECAHFETCTQDFGHEPEITCDSFQSWDMWELAELGFQVEEEDCE